MSFHKNNSMLQHPTSFSSSDEKQHGLKLPPISSMDSFLSTNTWNPLPYSASSPKEAPTTTCLPTPPQPEQWKSPPHDSRNELARDGLQKLPLMFSSTGVANDQQEKNTTTTQQHDNNPLDISSYFQCTSKAYHLQQQKRDPSSYHRATVNKLNYAIDQVVLQCNTLSDTMMQHKDQFTTHPHEQSSTRPLLDDMIGRANEVLNVLLRLRKHQIALEQHHSNLTQQHVAAATEEHLHLDHMEPDVWGSSTNRGSVTDINNHAKQRKRGYNIKKRPQFRGRCHSCNISETPEWRRGPDGARTLCNACGLHYAKLARKQQENRGMSNQLSTFSPGKLTPPADEIIID